MLVKGRPVYYVVSIYSRAIALCAPNLWCQLLTT